MGRFNLKTGWALSLSGLLLVTAVSQGAQANLLDRILGRNPKPKPVRHYPDYPDYGDNDGGYYQDDQPVDQRDMSEDERLEAEEERLGRPLTEGEREVKVAMDKFVYQPAVDMPIEIKKTTWTEDDEIEFGKFVAAIGQAVFNKKCGTATACFHDPKINKYAPLDPPTLQIYTDCADLPYFLRAYFAYHNGLPFSYVTQIAVNPTAYTSLDDQKAQLKSSGPANSPYGNRIVNRGGANVPARSGQEKNFLSYYSSLMDVTSTSTNRVGPMTPGAEMSDIFPVTLDRRGVRPGTIVAATGHAMIVWSVSPNGEIRIIDGHPGSYVQEHLLVSSKIQMSRPDQGIGYYQFRPLTLVGAKRSFSGNYYGGKVVPVSNDELIRSGRYSLEQFFGPGSRLTPGDKVDPNLWRKAFQKTTVFSYLTNNLRQQGVKVTADQDIANKVALLCSDIQDRLQNYEDSVAAGVAGSEHPDQLVQDVFGSADAAWEKFSTPGGDSRLRASVRDLVNDAVSNFKLAKSAAGAMTFAGSAQDYVSRLRQIVAGANANCAIAYTNSVGEKVSLSLNEVTKRLNRLSFDPYMCPEKSWGATGSELSTCQDQDNNSDWYNSERYMRNVIGKNDDYGNSTLRSDRPITLNMLRNTSLIDLPASSNINLGTARAPVMNLDATFASDDFLNQLLSK
jgi:hypothetical protein